MTRTQVWNTVGPNAFQRLFGTLDTALAAAGLTKWPVREKRIWDRASIVSELRANARSGARASHAVADAISGRDHFGGAVARSPAAFRAAANEPYSRTATGCRLAPRSPRRARARNSAASVTLLQKGTLPTGRQAAIRAAPFDPKWR